MKKSNQKSPGRCVFCFNPGDLTKQHVFSAFLLESIPKSYRGSLHTNIDYGTGAPLNSRTTKTQQGDVNVRQVRNVCRNCNNGWISNIEQAVKPTLISLIKAEEIFISEEDISLIVKWVVITSIMAEYTNPSEQAIHESHRIAMFENKELSDVWRIYIGKYEGKDDNIVYRHTSVLPLPGVSDLRNINKLDHVGHPNYCQCTTIILGGFFIVAASLPDQRIRYMFDYYMKNFGSKLNVLWPSEANESLLVNIFPKKLGKGFKWGTKKAIDDNDHLNITHILIHIKSILELQGY